MKNGAAMAVLVALSACNQAAPTYVLLAVPDAGVRDAFVPPDAGRPPPPPDSGVIGEARDDGLPCERNQQCEGGLCLTGADFPDGYCSSRCTRDDQCDRPSGTCVAEFEQQFCARSCFNGGVCRTGYQCREAGGELVCLPPPIVIGDGTDGAACRDDGDCIGGRCFLPPDWPGGYCTTPDCFFDEDCHPSGNGARCAWVNVPASAPIACLESCAQDTDCRDGYGCAPIEIGSRACIPDSSTPPELDPPVAYPFEMKCGATEDGPGRFSFTFDVPANATSYTISPIARDGNYLLPTAIDLPSGGMIDFTQENEFQLITPIFRPWISPTLIPTVSQLEGQLEAGRHTFRLESSSSDLCWQFISEESDGAEIDLRIYFVGVPNVDAASAPGDPNVSAMLERMDELLSQVGLAIGDVVFRDVSPEDAAKYSMVEEEHHVGEIVALSEPELDDLDSALVMNLFFVETFLIGPLGIASALPGPPGLHGTQASGVISSAEYLGITAPGPNGEPIDGTHLTALIAVHEIGHFLGLLHTTEIDGEERTFDPVLDTPECTIDLTTCPDLGNIMFPYADPGNVTLTEGQGYTMKKNQLSEEP